jgi:hypothetical protein
MSPRKPPRLVWSQDDGAEPKAGRPRQSYLPPAVEDSTIARLREIARPPDDLDRLVDNVQSHPDAQLLDLCSEALHLLRSARAVHEARPPWRNDWEVNGREAQAWRDAALRALEESEKLVTRAKPLLRRAGKMRAVTGAGVYGKALLVRSSRTGAQVLAKSLAEDLITIPGLRVSLWPTDSEGGAT